MKTKPIVGQRMFALAIIHNSRLGESELSPVTVTKVGRKYFSAKLDGYEWTREYHLDSWLEKSVFSPGSRLYASEQEWEDEKEVRRLVALLRETFAFDGIGKQLSLETLRAICALLP